MQQTGTLVAHPSDVFRGLMGLRIGKSLIPYMLLNDKNDLQPGYHPFLDNMVLYDIKRLIEGQLRVLYNVLEHSMDDTSQAWTDLEFFLSIFVSLVEMIGQEHVGAFLDQRQYENEKLSIRFPIILTRLCENKGQKFLGLLMSRSAESRENQFSLLLRRYFAAVMSAPAELIKAFPYEEVQELLDSAKLLEQSLRTKSVTSDQGMDAVGVHDLLRQQLLGEGSETATLKLASLIIELERDQKIEQLVSVIYGIGYLFGTPECSREGDAAILNTLVLTVLNEAKTSQSQRSLLTAVLLLAELKDFSLVHLVQSIWQLEPRSGFYLPNISNFRKFIDNLSQLRTFKWLVMNLLSCSLYDRYQRNKAEFEQHPFGPYINNGPPSVIAEVVSATKCLVIKSFVALSLELGNHAHVNQCLQSLENLLDGKLPRLGNDVVPLPADPDHMFIADLKHEYFVEAIRVNLIQQDFFIDWDWDIELHHYKQLLLKNLGLILNTNQFLIVIQDIELIKAANLKLLGDDWKHTLHLINVSKVPAASYINFNKLVDIVKLQAEGEEQRLRERMLQKQLLQIEYERLISQPKVEPILKPAASKAGSGNNTGQKAVPNISDKQPSAALAKIRALGTQQSAAASKVFV